MPVQIRVRCPQCAGHMLFDPRSITTTTGCIYCPASLMPADHVVPEPMPVPIVQPLPKFDIYDEPRPRRTRHEVKVQDSFQTGFGASFGGCLGIAAAVFVLIAGLIVGGFFITEAKRDAQSTKQIKR